MRGKIDGTTAGRVLENVVDAAGKVEAEPYVAQARQLLSRLDTLGR